MIVVGKGGHSGLTLHPLTPARRRTASSGLTTGFVFAALSFVGFEAAATLADESPRAAPDRPARGAAGAWPASARSTSSASGRRSSASAREKTNALDGSSTPWNDLAATYASWMKWPVIVASVSSMFAVMINSSNGIVRILNTMGREGLLPRTFALHPPEAPDARRTPSSRPARSRSSLALSVGAIAGGWGDPLAGANVYGYLGFLLTLGILPVYVLTNLAAARYFAGTGRFHLIRHGMLPLGGAALMVALLIGQIVEQTASRTRGSRGSSSSGWR